LEIKGDHDVRVRLLAAGINPVDYKLRQDGSHSRRSRGALRFWRSAGARSRYVPTGGGGRRPPGAGGGTGDRQGCPCNAVNGLVPRVRPGGRGGARGTWEPAPLSTADFARTGAVSTTWWPEGVPVGTRRHQVVLAAPERGTFGPAPPCAAGFGRNWRRFDDLAGARGAGRHPACWAAPDSTRPLFRCRSLRFGGYLRLVWGSRTNRRRRCPATRANPPPKAISATPATTVVMMSAPVKANEP
jgi:hypothetical protein